MIRLYAIFSDLLVKGSLITIPAENLAIGKRVITFTVDAMCFPPAFPPFSLWTPVDENQFLIASQHAVVVRPPSAFALDASSLPCLFYDIFGESHCDTSLY